MAFIQYMPRKPIKHGIKVFAVCCAYTGVMLGFEVYCGPESVAGDKSALAVVEHLLNDNRLTNASGRTVYTDNWYTTMDLARNLYDKHRMLFCGTMTLTDKKSRQDLDVPFHKLSRAAKDGVERGWYREAAIELKTRTGKKFYAQHTTWKDRKQVSFLHTNNIGPSSGHSVNHSSRGQRGRSTFKAPNAQKDYAKHFNAVDQNDRDSADYTTSLKTHRWYLRIFFWLFDRVIHQLYVIVIYCAKYGIGPDEWEVYLKKNGRKIFQIDLARECMNYAIRHAWPDLNGPKPNWMRQAELVPCECKKCFFCLNNLTSGIAHKRKRGAGTTFIHRDNKRTKTVGCTDKRVNLQADNNYCKQCYRERPGTREQKLHKINKSRLGCPNCGEHICKYCWAKGYDMHQPQSR